MKFKFIENIQSSKGTEIPTQNTKIVCVAAFTQWFNPDHQSFSHTDKNRASWIHSVERRMKLSPTGQELPGLMVRVRPGVRGRWSLLYPACPSVPPRLLAALSHPICPHPQRALTVSSQPLPLLARGPCICLRV